MFFAKRKACLRNAEFILKSPAPGSEVVVVEVSTQVVVGAVHSPKFTKGNYWKLIYKKKKRPDKPGLRKYEIFFFDVLQVDSIHH